MVIDILVRTAILGAVFAIPSWLLAVVHGEDDRVPLFVGGADQRLNPRLGLEMGLAASLRGVGSIRCKDGTVSTAFLIDTSPYVSPDVEQPSIIASVSHAFFNRAGKSRGKCWYHQSTWEFFAAETVKVGAKLTSDSDPNDWAFAQVAVRTATGKHLDTRYKLSIEFQGLYDFSRDAVSPADFVTAAYIPARGMVGVASNCRPDNKREYSWFAESHHDWSKMIIHDCDFLRAGSGGPLLKRSPTGLSVIGVNIGDADPRKEELGDVSGVQFNPPHTFNYSRRFDIGLKHQLLHFLEATVGPEALLVDL